MNENALLRNIIYEIKRNGSNFSVSREVLNDRNEGTGVFEKVGTFRGIFHQTKQYQSVSVNNVTRHTTRPQPMILTNVKEIEKIGALKERDVISYAGIDYRVCAINDVESFGVAFDISLEVVSDGRLQN